MIVAGSSVICCREQQSGEKTVYSYDAELKPVDYDISTGNVPVLNPILLFHGDGTMDSIYLF